MGKKQIASEKENYFLKNYRNFPLYYWSYSSIDGNTAFFYFLDKKNNKLIFIEYWLDEDTVADTYQLYSVNGQLLTDYGINLSNIQKTYFTDICKKEVRKAMEE